jgi:hypothetical protein
MTYLVVHRTPNGLKTSRFSTMDAAKKFARKHRGASLYRSPGTPRHIQQRRRRARKNPSTQTTTLLIAGGGLALLGVGVYLFTKKPAAASTTTTAITATGPRPFGDPADMLSVAHACNTCWKLNALGHPREAAAWCTKCTAGGGVVPQSAAQLYT